ncbi:MAG TPA: NAD(P)H-binding protein [Gemmatirosa sp.]
MIVVTGATGPLGRGVVQHLLQRVPAHQVGVSVRDPAKAADVAALGVRVRSGDFASPDTLGAAFAGAAQVLVVSVNQLGDAARSQHRAAIRAARAAGARRVLYTSHLGARVDSPFAPGADHAVAEAVLDEGAAPFTALRHGFYAESALHLIAHGLAAGEIRAPEDGPVSWTMRADLAEADAILLAEEGRLDGITPPLTAREAFTMADVARVASELTGREIRRVTLTDDAWRDEMVAHGTPAPVAELLLGMYRAARRGDFATVDPTLGALLGRRPRTMRDALAAHVRRGPGTDTDAPHPTA